MKLTEIHNSGVYEAHFNGLWRQEVIFVNENKEKYRISINQTKEKAVLSKWSDGEGWVFILEKGTETNYNIKTTYKDKENITQTVYEPIIKDMRKLIQHF